ncbi:unnamed protein product [Protopolystoma xenopodis]|uniref:Uncharacterized protein n=1 Tax=Protopolystoma xenopodis TaxID=117903 RepID=A0A448WTN6_9PLAT|nr:unnamed protein product [Protopolystoma xenopodis]
MDAFKSQSLSNPRLDPPGYQSSDLYSRVDYSLINSSPYFSYSTHPSFVDMEMEVPSLCPVRSLPVAPSLSLMPTLSNPGLDVETNANQQFGHHPTRKSKSRRVRKQVHSCSRPPDREI